MNRNVEDDSITDFVDKVKSARNEYVRQRQELMSCEPERLGIYLDVRGNLLAHTDPFEWMWIIIKRTGHADLCRVDTWHSTKYVECANCGEVVGTYYVTCPYCGYRLSARKPTTGMDPLYGMTDSEFYKRFGSM